MFRRFSACNSKSLYGFASLKIITRELGKQNLDLVEVQEFRWGKVDTEII
jgi:hypothetical protein